MGDACWELDIHNPVGYLFEVYFLLGSVEAYERVF
jgi:hypothetical protein